jgi:hypothetical protein
VTPTLERRARFAVRFTCRHLRHAGKVIDAKGTFVAFR